MAGKKQDPLKRFWKRVNKTDNCWLWTGSLQQSNYGQFWTGDYQTTAHRFSWEIHNGNIPKGYDICHVCDVKICVNPEHLFLGTRLDNMKDCINKGRTAKGEKHGKSKLTNNQVKQIRQLAISGLSQRAIASQFSVSQPEIGCIIRNEIWQHLTKEN